MTTRERRDSALAMAGIALLVIVCGIATILGGSSLAGQSLAGAVIAGGIALLIGAGLFATGGER